MPSRNNPNLPSSLKRKCHSKKRGVRRITRPRVTVEPSELVTKTGSGVHHKRTLSGKQEKKKNRNMVYAKQRAVEMAAEEIFNKIGEVEMTDISEVTLSRRQLKKAAMAAAAVEENKVTINARVNSSIAHEKVESAMEID